MAASFFLLAPYIAVEATLSLVGSEHPETTWIGIAPTAVTFVLEPPLGYWKRRVGSRLGSAATAGEGTQNLLCAYLAGAVMLSLVANTVAGVWWLDGAVALVIAAWALVEGRRTLRGEGCQCAAPADAGCIPPAP